MARAYKHVETLKEQRSCVTDGLRRSRVSGHSGCMAMARRGVTRDGIGGSQVDCCKETPVDVGKQHETATGHILNATIAQDAM